MAVSTLGILGQSAADLAAQIARYKRAGHIALRTLGEAREAARRHHERAMNYIAGVRAELAGMAAIEAQEMDALGRDLAEAAVRNYEDAPGCHAEAGPVMGPMVEVTRPEIDGQGDLRVLMSMAASVGTEDATELPRPNCIPVVNFDGLPTRLDAPTLHGEVLHSNGHGTYTVTPLPRPAHMEDAEARHAEAITAQQMDEEVERAGLAEGLAAKVGPPKGDSLDACVRERLEGYAAEIGLAPGVASAVAEATETARREAATRAATAGRQQQTRGKRRGAK